MIRFLALVFIGLATFAVLYFVNHPEVFNDAWLYLIGLAGAVIRLSKVVWEKIKSFGADVKKQMHAPLTTTPPATPAAAPPATQTSTQISTSADAVG